MQSSDHAPFGGLLGSGFGNVFRTGWTVRQLLSCELDLKARKPAKPKARFGTKKPVSAQYAGIV
jgi:hypothetical protein